MPNQFSRAQGLPQTLVALSLFLIILTSAGSAVAQLSRTEFRSVATTQMESSADNLQRALDEEASSSLAVFIPSHDVLGNPNPVPAPGSVAQQGATTAYDPLVSPAANSYATAAHEVDMYTRDGQHVPHLTAYLWSPTTSTIAKYRYAYRDASGAAQGVELDETISNVTWFGASYLMASQTPETNAFIKANAHVAIQDVTVYMGEPEVYGGNRGTVVEYAFGLAQTINGKTAIEDPIEDAVTLAPTTFPGGRTIKTTYSASHNPIAVDCSSFSFEAGVPGSITESGPSCPASSGGDTFAVSDSNYTGPYTLSSSDCGSAGVSIVPSGTPNGPTAGYTIGTGVGVTPGATVSCLVQILTSDPAIAAAVNISVMATPTPTPMPTPSPTATPAPPTPSPTPTGVTDPLTCPAGEIGTYPNCYTPPATPTPTPPGSEQAQSETFAGSGPEKETCPQPKDGVQAPCHIYGPKLTISGPFDVLLDGNGDTEIFVNIGCTDGSGALPSAGAATPSSSDGKLQAAPNLDSNNGYAFVYPGQVPSSVLLTFGTGTAVGDGGDGAGSSASGSVGTCTFSGTVE